MWGQDDTNKSDKNLKFIKLLININVFLIPKPEKYFQLLLKLLVLEFKRMYRNDSMD